MNPMQVIHGNLNPDGTLEVSDPITLPPGPVRITLETIPTPPAVRPDLVEVLEQIRQGQQARGYVGGTLEEMRAEEEAQRAEDEEYEERWRQLWSQTEGRS